MAIYETHLHTMQASDCAISRGRDYVRHYRQNGYAGIAVTDHFFRGNCAIDRSLPWEEFVRRFCMGYEDAYAEGQKQDFDVFFGWEENFEGDEYLIYGLDATWLLQHPDIITWTRAQYLQRVRDAGALVVQAHPFRQRNYIRGIHLCGTMTDAVEVGNMGNRQEEDALCAVYAQKLGVPMTVGNDIHKADPASSPEMGVVFPRRLRTVQAFCTAIKNNEQSLRLPKGRHTLTGQEQSQLPVYVHNAMGEIVDKAHPGDLLAPLLDRMGQ